MRNLIEFLARYNHWIVFTLLEVISLMLLFQYNSYQGSVWFTSANTVAGMILKWDAAVENFFSLTQVNQQLTQRNIYLESQLKKLNETLADKTKDTTWIERSSMDLLKGYKLIPAKVISNSINKQDNLITIDKGEADGVHKDMGVVSGTGVVGIVYMTSAHYAVIIPIINSQSSLSCTIRGRGYLGYLQWKGGDSQQAYMEDVPRHARFKLFDWVETSGYSAVFPPGMTVGRIRHVYNSPDGLSYRLKIILSTDFSNLRNVCVIDNRPAQERLQVLRAAQDSLKIKDNN